MTSVRRILDFLNVKAPMDRKMDFDNVGLLVGWTDAPVERVLVALDVTDEVIREAADMGAQLIVSHHPLFFGLKSVTDASWEGERALSLAENRIAAICMHTNLDAAKGGVNYALMDALGAEADIILDPETCIGLTGDMPKPMAFSDFLPLVRSALHANGLRYHDAGRTVRLLAVCGGSGGNMVPLVASMGCDTYVTSDVKYDQFLQAKHLGLNLIDAGHFCTENVVVPVLRDWLLAGFPGLDVRVSQVHSQTDQFF